MKSMIIDECTFACIDFQIHGQKKKNHKQKQKPLNFTWGKGR